MNKEDQPAEKTKKKDKQTVCQKRGRHEYVDVVKCLDCGRVQIKAKPVKGRVRR